MKPACDLQAVSNVLQNNVLCRFICGVASRVRENILQHPFQVFGFDSRWLSMVWPEIAHTHRCQVVITGIQSRTSVVAILLVVASVEAICIRCTERHGRKGLREVISES